MKAKQSEELMRQRNALFNLNDEIMSTLHAHQLREANVPSKEVVAWLRGLYDIVQEGLGKPAHFFSEREA